MQLSVIIPTLDEEAGLPATLESVRRTAPGSEIVVADGGSQDRTRAVAASFPGVSVITSPRGRGPQMNAGAAAATGDVLLFLHADTLLPWDALQAMLKKLGASNRAWGRFDVRLSSDRFMLRLIGWLINRRTRLTGIATGDQAIFVRRQVFETIGGSLRSR